jgi:hypothetical protein
MRRHPPARIALLVVESDPLLRPGDQIFVTPSLRLF